jgi:hypothetical protein
VQSFVAACPPESGWPASDAVGRYAAQELKAHVVEALLPDALEDTEAAMWLQHGAPVIAASVANAMGCGQLEALSATKEAAGELVAAARIAWATRLVHDAPAQAITEMAYRAAGLAADPSCAGFETELLIFASRLDVTSERNFTLMRRLAALQASGKPTFDSEWTKFYKVMLDSLMAWGFFTKPWPLPEVGAHDNVGKIISAVLIWGEAIKLMGTSQSLYHAVALHYQYLMATFILQSHDPQIWNPSLLGGETALADAMEFWTHEGSGKDMRGSAMKTDYYRGGCCCTTLALYFGNLSLIDKWAVNVIAAYEVIDYPSSRSFVGEAIEVFDGIRACRVLVELNRPAQAYAVLAAIGFDWSEDGLSLYECYQEAVASPIPGYHKEADLTFAKLVIYLACPQTAALDAQVSAWIPAPAVLAQHEHEYGWSMHWGIWGTLSLAARVFLQLGRDADAEETARIAVSPEHRTLRKYDLVQCRSILGQVAAKRGDVEEAGGHFAQGLVEARASRLPMLELLTARDWKRAAGASASMANADAVIDDACVVMGKSRAQLASVLSGS